MHDFWPKSPPLTPFQEHTMPQLKLNYFDFHGGRAEPARLALHMAGLAFEDHRLSFPQFGEFRSSTPFGQVPTLDVDGVQVTQCDAINRYVGKLTGLYPTDPLQALYCDEVSYVVEEANVRLGPTFRMTGDEQKAARLALVNGSMPVYLGWLQTQLLAHGGEFFADNRLTIADLKVFVDVRGLNSGRLDHVPIDLVERVAPALNAHLQRVASTPAIQAYYAQFAAK
jgi:prostaglandin-H2 D-isomerase / glutathione transferase